MSSTTSWRSFAEKLWSLPHAFDSRHSFAGEVVGSHEQGIVVERLRSGWFVVGVVHPDQYVSQERRKLAARFFHLVARRRRLQHSSNVGLHLQLGVPVVVDARCPLCSLASSEDRLRHFELPQFTRERDQRVVHRFSFRLLLQSFAQRQDRVQGY